MIRRRGVSAAGNNSVMGVWLADWHLNAFIIAGFFIIIFGTTLFLAYQQYEATRDLSLTEDKVTANLLANVIHEHQKAVISILQSYAGRPLFIAAFKMKNLAGVYRHLSDLKKNREIDLLFVTDRKGILWANFPVFSELMGSDQSHREWYKGISLEWSPYISSVSRLPVGDKPLGVAVCVPILDDTGTPIGVLGDSQRLDFLVDVIERVPWSPNTILSVIDRAGQVLYSNTYPYREKAVGHPSPAIIAQALRERRQRIKLHDPHISDRSHFAIAPVENIGWTIVVERRHIDILRLGYGNFIRSGVISLLLFLLISSSLIFLRRVLLFRKTEELLQTELRFRSLFESVKSGVAVYEAVEDGEDFVFRDVNRAVERIERVSREDLLGRRVTEVFPAVSELGLLEVFRRVWKTGKAENHPIGFYKDDRVSGWRDNYVYKLPSGEIVAVYDDISDRREAEEKLREAREELEQRVRERTAQLEATVKELEAFSYSVSHDLRAPLRGIDGFSQALLEDYQNKTLDDTGRHYLERIRKGAQRMGYLIDDMLKLARVTRSEFHTEPADLSRMISKITENLRQRDPERMVEVIIQERILTTVDPHLMRIAMTNLLENAWKFTGGKSPARIEFGTTVLSGETVYFFRDNGVGFDMAYADKLFGAFQRLHSVAEFPGTGIGLATVQRIIHRHGGHVWAEAETGKGATFFFTLHSWTSGSGSSDSV